MVHLAWSHSGIHSAELQVHGIQNKGVDSTEDIPELQVIRSLMRAGLRQTSPCNETNFSIFPLSGSQETTENCFLTSPPLQGTLHFPCFVKLCDNVCFPFLTVTSVLRRTFSPFLLFLCSNTYEPNVLIQMVHYNVHR